MAVPLPSVPPRLHHKPGKEQHCHTRRQIKEKDGPTPGFLLFMLTGILADSTVERMPGKLCHQVLVRLNQAATGSRRSFGITLPPGEAVQRR